MIIRYEDLKLNIKEIVIKVIDFLNNTHRIKLNLTDADIDQIIENSNFNNLKKIEDKYGFDESSKHSSFFRTGTSNQWKDILSKTQLRLIENNLQTLMRQFNYF